MKMNYKNQLLALGLIFLLFACEESGKERPLGAYDTGILIMNEGSFGTNDGEIFHLDPATGMMKENIFEAENNRPFAGLL